MNATVNQYYDRVLNRLNSIEKRLQDVKANLQRLPELEEEAVRGELEASRTKLRPQRQRIEHSLANLKARSQQNMVEESKENQEAQDLHAHATQAEANAADAIDHAIASIDEVEDAVLYAAVARLTADATM